MVVVVVDENNRNMVVVVGKVQQKCVGGGCGETKNSRYVMVVDREKINKRKN